MNPIPAGPFDVILADPPWSYRNHTDARNGAAASHYETQPDGWVEELPVGDACAENCALFMWATWPKLREALSTIDAWGFEFLTCAFVWVKTYDDRSPYCGLGFYTRSGTEFCLLAKRGSVPVADKSVRQVITAPVREHSKKPPEVVWAIERLYPKARKLEMFAREYWPGWTAWGNETRPAMPLWGQE